MSNTTTAYDMMVLYEKIANSEVLSKESNEKMIEILLDQYYNEMIPAKLPTDVKVAHKTGSITGVRHDAGIVMLPDGKKYVLVLLSKNLENPDASIEKMAEVSGKIYQYVIDNYKNS